MWLQLSARYPTNRRRPIARRLGSFATALLCAAALSFCTGPAVASVFVRIAGSLSEELPTETHSWSDAQHRTGARLRVGTPGGRQVEADGPLRRDLPDHVSAAGQRVVNARRLVHLSGFVPSPATEMIRSGIQLRC